MTWPSTLWSGATRLFRWPGAVAPLDLFFGSLVVNGVDVVPWVEEELNRRFPGRALQHARTLEGLREGWVAVQAAWEDTVTSTPAALVDAHVPDEWRPTVGDCVRVILEEEWAHLRHIRRDHALLTGS